MHAPASVSAGRKYHQDMPHVLVDGEASVTSDGMQLPAWRGHRKQQERVRLDDLCQQAFRPYRYT